jgi:hypothetical protein
VQPLHQAQAAQVVRDHLQAFLALRLLMQVAVVQEQLMRAVQEAQAVVVQVHQVVQELLVLLIQAAVAVVVEQAERQTAAMAVQAS